MAKLLVMIASGPKDPAKVKAGLGFSLVANSNPAVQDVKICFFADGVEVLDPAQIEPFEKLLNKMHDAQMFSMACQLHAEQKQIDTVLRSNPYSVDLHYVGDDLVQALVDGYQFVTF